MICIAPSAKDTDNAALEKHLCDAAEQSRANSGLKSQEYSAPVLSLIFLRFAEARFAAKRAKLESPSTVLRTPSPPPGEKDGKRGCTAGTGDVPRPACPAVDHGWMNPPPITPKASSIFLPRRGWISGSRGPRRSWSPTSD